MWLVVLFLLHHNLPCQCLQNHTKQVLHKDNTFVMVTRNNHGLVIHCDVEERTSIEDEKQLAAQLSQHHHVEQASLSDLISLLIECQNIDQVNRNDKSLETEPSEASSSSWFESISLLPGTKWCGSGDDANNWNDLGEDRNLDVCCRTHDMCPVKVKSFHSRYGYSNLAMVTRSHCACDDEFRRCLTDLNTPSAQMVGTAYFNLIRMKCLLNSPECTDTATTNTTEVPPQSTCKLKAKIQSKFRVSRQTSSIFDVVKTQFWKYLQG